MYINDKTKIMCFKLNRITDLIEADQSFYGGKKLYMAILIDYNFPNINLKEMIGRSLV